MLAGGGAHGPQEAQVSVIGGCEPSAISATRAGGAPARPFDQGSSAFFAMALPPPKVAEAATRQPHSPCSSVLQAFMIRRLQHIGDIDVQQQHAGVHGDALLPFLDAVWVLTRAEAWAPAPASLSAQAPGPASPSASVPGHAGRRSVAPRLIGLLRRDRRGSVFGLGSRLRPRCNRGPRRRRGCPLGGAALPTGGPVPQASPTCPTTVRPERR
jgi:hypothetical protein